MRSLRGQFILSHILPFLLILPLAGLVILYLAETQVALVELSDTLEEQAALIAAAVAQQPNVMADSDAAQRFVDDIGRLIDGDFYLLAADGRLLAAENGSDITPETDAVGPGVKAILDGTDPASTVRVSTAYGLLAQSGEAVAPVLNVNEQLIGIVGVRKSISGIAAAFGPLRRLVAFTVLGGALLGMLLGYELAKRLAEPIGRTVDAVERIGRGEQEAALPAGGPTEMRRLTEAVNSLAARLRMLEEMRRRSFANIVHELGRPLGAVLAAVEVLRGSPVTIRPFAPSCWLEFTKKSRRWSRCSTTWRNSTPRPPAASGWIGARWLCRPGSTRPPGCGARPSRSKAWPG